MILRRKKYVKNFAFIFHLEQLLVFQSFMDTL